MHSVKDAGGATKLLRRHYPHAGDANTKTDRVRAARDEGAETSCEGGGGKSGGVGDRPLDATAGLAF
jgi:hypothetical protein